MKIHNGIEDGLPIVRVRRAAPRDDPLEGELKRADPQEGVAPRLRLSWPSSSAPAATTAGSRTTQPLRPAILRLVEEMVTRWRSKSRTSFRR